MAFMLKNLTIKFRLIFVIGFLCLMSVVIGTIGLISLNTMNSSIKTLYENRVVALGQLSTVLSLMQQNQLTLSNSISGTPEHYKKAVDEVAARIEKITAVWKTYTATYLTAEEKIIAQRFAERRGEFVTGALVPAISALKDGDQQRATGLVNGPVIDLFKPAQAAMNELIQLQLTVSQAEFAASESRFASSRMFAIGAVLFGLLVGVVVGYGLISGISRSIAQALCLARSVALGDLTQKIEIHSNDEIGQLLLALRTMNEKLVSIVRQVRSGTETIATASSQIAAGNMDLSSRTEQQASSLEETAASMEELTSTVKQNADNARRANQLAMSASDVAVRGGTVVSQVVDTMNAINDSAKKIADIIGVIDGIAFQTNILALNAAVEAARAGEQGRGFAVVATEVRSLAQRSAAAAKEIKTLIGDSVDKVDAGSKLVAEAGSTMNEVVSSVKRVTDMMGEITAASQEQSAGIEQVNQAVSQMDQVTQQNAALVEEAAAAAESLQEQSSRLAQSVSVFQLSGNHTALTAAIRTVSSHVNAKATPALASSRTRSSVAPRMQAPMREKAITTSAAEGWEEF